MNLLCFWLLMMKMEEEGVSPPHLYKWLHQVRKTNPEDKISSVGAVQLLGSKAQYSLCLCFISDSLHWIPALRQQWQHGVPVSSHGNCLYWNGCCYRWWRWGVHGAGSGGVSNLIQAFFFFLISSFKFSVLIYVGFTVKGFFLELLIKI